MNDRATSVIFEHYVSNTTNDPYSHVTCISTKISRFYTVELKPNPDPKRTRVKMLAAARKDVPHAITPLYDDVYI
jgi:hypothetical protein